MRRASGCARARPRRHRPRSSGKRKRTSRPRRRPSARGARPPARVRPRAPVRRRRAASASPPRRRARSADAKPPPPDRRQGPAPRDERDPTKFSALPHHFAGTPTVHVHHLSVTDYRSYPTAELPLGPGVTTLVGPNGQGKTNLVEAVGYLATLSSHRVATDQPLVRFGADRAVIRGVVVRDGRETLVELELNPGRANRARLNRAPMP